MEYHEYANLFPMMTQAEYSELVNDMRENGYDKTAPIILYQNRILDGRNRWEAAQDAEVIPLLVEFDGDDALGFVIRHNLKRRHLNESQRAIVAGRLANLQHGQRVDRVANLQLSPVTQSAAAEMLNVSPRMVAAAKAIEREAPELVEFIEGGQVTVNSAAKISNLSNEERRLVIDELRVEKQPYIHISDNSYEWYTPIEYIQSARAVMGEITVDPASCKEANKIIGANVFYTKDENGLSALWSGNVWLNPPYSMPEVEDFTHRAITLYREGVINQCIILVNNSTDTLWFHALLSHYPVCFTKGRVKFYGPNASQARQGQAIFYLGNQVRKFMNEFSKFGIVMTRAE